MVSGSEPKDHPLSAGRGFGEGRAYTAQRRRAHRAPSGRRRVRGSFPARGGGGGAGLPQGRDRGRLDPGAGGAGPTRAGAGAAARSGARRGGRDVARAARGCRTTRRWWSTSAPPCLHGQHFVGDALFRRAVSTLRDQGVVDLIGVSGYDALVSMILNVAAIPLPAGVVSPLVKRALPGSQHAPRFSFPKRRSRPVVNAAGRCS